MRAVMDTNVQIPELLLQEVRELASQQNASVDQIVSAALVAQVSAWRTRESVASRAGRVNWQQVDEILVGCRTCHRQMAMNCNQTRILNVRHHQLAASADVCPP